jgi:hypothetical protein
VCLVLLLLCRYGWLPSSSLLGALLVHTLHVNESHDRRRANVTTPATIVRTWYDADCCVCIYLTAPRDGATERVRESFLEHRVTFGPAKTVERGNLITAETVGLKRF